MSDRNNLDNEVARRYLDLVVEGQNLASPTTPSGDDLEDRIQDTLTNPMDDEGQMIYGDEFGSFTVLEPGNEDDVLTMESGIPTWKPSSGGGGGGPSGYYRQFVIELDGAGGFDFLLDEDGSPIMALESLE